MNMIGLCKASLVLVMALFSSIANSIPMLDQSNDTIGTVAFNGFSPSLSWQQGVTVGKSGQLAQIDLYFSVAGQVDFSVNVGSPWQSDANDFFESIYFVEGWNSINILEAEVSLLAGEKFVIGLEGIGGISSANFRGTVGNSYAGGSVYLNGEPNIIAGYDINFRTYVDPVLVSEPSSLALLLFGLFGLVLNRKYRN